MASLAIIVSLIFLLVICSGPIVYLIARLNIFPKILVDFICLLTIAIGLWWTIIIPTFVRFFGLLTILLAWKAMMLSRKGA